MSLLKKKLRKKRQSYSFSGQISVKNRVYSWENVCEDGWIHYDNADYQKCFLANQPPSSSTFPPSKSTEIIVRAYVD